MLGAAALFLLLTAAYSFSIDLRATRGAAITGDEPFYLLTTQSLLEDGDLDLRQQYERQSYTAFFDHPDGLWRQSVPMPDGRILSPHNPGLSVLVLPGFALGGLRGAQVELVLLAALTMALAYVLVAQVTRAPLLAWLTTVAVAVSATAFVYSSEVYPEFPAALCLVVALLLGRRAPTAAISMALVALLTVMAWLGIKYVPLGAIVAAPFLLKAGGRERALFLGLGTIAGIAYVWFHVGVFGDLTPYSVNTVYQGAPTLTVLEHHLSFFDRVYRLWGLFIDQRFGIGRWAPLLLLAPLAAPLLLRGGSTERTVLALMLTQLAIATFVAITMMGWWFPGRTLVVVIPLFALPLTMALQQAGWAGRICIAALAVLGLVFSVALVQVVSQEGIRLAVDPFDMRFTPFQAFAPLFPDYRAWTAGTVALTIAWVSFGLTATAFSLSKAWARESRAMLLLAIRAPRSVWHPSGARLSRREPGRQTNNGASR